MATIAVVNAPYIGHIVPATRLGAALARAGHRVVAWSIESMRAEVEAAGLRARSLGRVPPLRAPSFADVATAAAGLTAEVTGRLVEDLLAEGADLVVHDSMAPWGRVAARWLGLPTVSSWAIFPRVDPSAGWDGQDATSPEAFESSRRAVARRWGVDLGSAVAVLANAGDANLSHTTPEILGRPLPDATWRFVGTLRGPAVPAGGPGFGGDDRRPLVYVSLGTISNGDPAPFHAALEALEAEEVRVVVATGGRLTRADLEPVPGNAVVADRLMPSHWQHAVLERAAAFVTHCGTGTAHDALFAGVPMVCMPQGGDQPAMASRVAELGAGRLLDRYTADAIRAAVRSVLDDEAFGRRARRIGDHLRAFDGAAEAARTVEALLP